MKRQVNKAGLALLLGIFAFPTYADTVSVSNIRLDEPALQPVPFLVDSTDVHGKTFAGIDTLQTASFAFQNGSFADVTMTVEGVANPLLTVDGSTVDGHVSLQPNIHHARLTFHGTSDALKVTLSTKADGILSLPDVAAGDHYYSIADVLHAQRFSRIELSDDGRFLLSTVSRTLPGGTYSEVTRLTDLSKGTSRTVAERYPRWIPGENRYWYTRTRNSFQELVAVDVQTGAEEVLADNLPAQGHLEFAPTGDWLLVSTSEEGPRENEGVYEVIEPEDRQPGWRNRSNLARYDLSTHQLTTLTYGHHNVYASDISADGRYILLQTSRSRYTQRPTDVSSAYRLDVQTMAVDTLVVDDGFLNGGCFSPDGSEVLFSGSPECLGGVGKNVPEGRIPSSVDVQLYRMDIATRKVTPLTLDFDPCVESFIWNRNDGRIWFTAGDKDSINLFVLDPANNHITEMSMPEELVSRINFAEDAPVAVWYGSSASNSDRMYTLSWNTKRKNLDAKSLTCILREDLSAETLKDVTLGECRDWMFVNSRGEMIYGRFYLPPVFDESRQYPMVVNYYGGCSPTERNFESRYPHHAYAALGYVVLVINPSGATGFGQEFSSRHVNTAGQGVAEDIVEGTKTFCREHPFVNTKKIGCIGASYGGFMTQYLLTQTDIFAAGISHAGISDHTSYWGEGYWGYSYSEVSMAESYPWTRKDLYVDQSPLYNADKIHTPLLFVHGDSDTNVPVGESIQMYTALKLLGRPTAMVLVKGQNHWITDYEKRIRWQNTIFAWFARYLQDDDAWWQSMYPDKSL